MVVYVLSTRKSNLSFEFVMFLIVFTLKQIKLRSARIKAHYFLSFQMTVTYIINVPKYIVKHFLPPFPLCQHKYKPWYAKYAKMF